MKRRIAAIAAVLSLCFSMVSATALCLAMAPSAAFADEHKHPICGKSHVDMQEHSGTCADLAWTEVTSAAAMPNASGNYYLGSDITLSETWTLPTGETINLCLNGKSLSGGNAVQVIHVPKGATLNICDCSTGESGKITGGYAKESASTHYNAGGGISVVRGSLNLFGGSISGNKTQYFQAGGVNLFGSTFNMFGGSISGNTAAGNGGGVYLAHSSGSDGQPSRFILYGGVISGNNANLRGGGVYVNSSHFEMNGGKVEGNTANDGGGVSADGGDVLLRAGKISGNLARSWGGGLWLSSLTEVILFSGGSIADNHVENSSSQAASDIHFASSATRDSAVLGVAGPLAASAGSSGLMYVSAAADFGAGVVAQGVDGDGDGVPYAITSADAGRFVLSPLAPAGGLDLFLDELSNQIMLGREFDVATTSFELSETSFAYNGEPQKPALTVKSGDTELVEGANRDYVIEWPDDVISAGTKTLVVKGSLSAPGYYAGSKTLTFTITPKAIAPVIVGVKDEYTYTGSRIEPAVAVMDGQTKLVEDRDYVLSYGDNMLVADGGSVKVTLKGNYAGSAEKTFSISKAVPTCTAPTAAGFTYDGTYHYLVHAGEALAANGSPMEVLYSLSENGDYGADIPQARKAGSYTVWWKVEGDANHESVGPYPVDVVVLAAQLQPVGLKAKNREFDGTRQVEIEELTLAGIHQADDVRVDLSSLKGMLDAANAGTYDTVVLGQLRLIGSDAGNYFVSAGVEVDARPSVVISQSEGSSTIEVEIVVGSEGKPEGGSEGGLPDGGASGGSSGGSSGGALACASNGGASFEIDLYELLEGVVGYIPDQDDDLSFEISPAYDGDVFESVSVEEGKLVVSLKQGLPAGAYSEPVSVKVTGMTNYSELTLSVAIGLEVAAAPEPNAIAATGDRTLQRSAAFAAAMLVAAFAMLVSRCRRAA